MNNSSKRIPGTEGYAENAVALVAQYENIHFNHLHRDTLHLFPAPPSIVLDIGAGSGRDAAALAGLGHQVLAVEPTAEMRHHAQRLHPHSKIEWLDDALPELSQVAARGQRFDLVLLTAVWMHLDRDGRQVAMRQLARLVCSTGRIVMSLRHGPVPIGRRMFDVRYEETDQLARQEGLRAIFRSDREAELGSPEVCWTFLALMPDR